MGRNSNGTRQGTASSMSASRSLNAASVSSSWDGKVVHGGHFDTSFSGTPYGAINLRSKYSKEIDDAIQKEFNKVNGNNSLDYKLLRHYEARLDIISKDLLSKRKDIDNAIVGNESKVIGKNFYNYYNELINGEREWALSKIKEIQYKKKIKS